MEGIKLNSLNTVPFSYVNLRTMLIERQVNRGYGVTALLGVNASIEEISEMGHIITIAIYTKSSVSKLRT